MRNNTSPRHTSIVAMILVSAVFGSTPLRSQETVGVSDAPQSGRPTTMDDRPTASAMPGGLIATSSIPEAGTPRTLQEQIDRIVVARMTLEAVIQALEESEHSGDSNVTLSEADFRKQFESDPDVPSILAAIEERQASIFELEATTVDASKTARYKRLSSELQRYEETLAAIRDDIRQRLARSSGSAARREREEAIASFQARAALYRRVEQLLRDRLAEGESKADHLRAAVEHLRIAGRDDFANPLATEAEKLPLDLETTPAKQPAEIGRAALDARIDALQKELNRLRERIEQSFRNARSNPD